MYDLRAQYENAGDAGGQDCDQQRAVVGELAHRDLASALLHALDREWKGRGRYQHGRDRRGALTETVADRQQSRRRPCPTPTSPAAATPDISWTMRRDALRPAQPSAPPMMSGMP